MLFKDGKPIDLRKEFIGLHRIEPDSTDSKKIMRTNIMGYELGDIQRFTNKNAQKNLDTKSKKILEANAKLGMADLLAQCYMLCLDMNWNFEEIQLLGLDHLRERQVEIQRDGWGEE